LRTIPPIVLALAALGCTPSHIQVRKAPADAINAAVTRLEARDVAFDPAGRRPDRARSAHFCYRPLHRSGGGFDASFQHAVAGGPVGFEHTAPLDDQAPVRKRCEWMFRFEVHARPYEGESRIEVQTDWWRIKNTRCVPEGNPLLGVLRCDYAYTAAHKGPDDLPGFIYRILSGL
jgi:hypothetical protein